jgi:hypothetical protein
MSASARRKSEGAVLPLWGGGGHPGSLAASYRSNHSDATCASPHGGTREMRSGRLETFALPPDVFLQQRRPTRGEFKPA